MFIKSTKIENNGLAWNKKCLNQLKLFIFPNTPLDKTKRKAN